MQTETKEERSKRILSLLKEKYPNAKALDLDGSSNHFVSEVEPASEHPEYDRAIEVIFRSKPHKHIKMTQTYTMLSGALELHAGNKTVLLKQGDTYTIKPPTVHWGECKEGECWLEIYSTPGWTPEDHIPVEP